MQVWSMEANQRFNSRFLSELRLVRSKMLIEELLMDPATQLVRDRRHPSSEHNRVVFQRMVTPTMMMRVPVAIEGDHWTICTLYGTSKIRKYWNVDLVDWDSFSASLSQ